MDKLKKQLKKQLHFSEAAKDGYAYHEQSSPGIHAFLTLSAFITKYIQKSKLILHAHIFI